MSASVLLTPEEREARTKARKAEYYRRPEVKARKAEYRARPEIKALIKARAASYRARPEVKARNRARKVEKAGYEQRPEVKARRKAQKIEYFARPEVKARRRLYTAEYNARPEVKARKEARRRLYMAEYNARPEVKARRNAKSRAVTEMKARLEGREVRRHKRISRTEAKFRQRAFRYGITLETLGVLLAADCAASILGARGGCRGGLQIDHDHQCCDRFGSCGKCVRGALCHKHNTALSQYESSLSWAGKYLARHQANQEGGRS